MFHRVAILSIELLPGINNIHHAVYSNAIIALFVRRLHFATLMYSIKL